MAVILNNKKSTYGSPYCYYTLEYTSTANRTATSVDITFKVTSHLAYQSSTFGTGRTLKAQIYINGSWSAEQTLKSSSDSWAGTGNHTKTFTLTINNLNSTDTTLSNIKFKVNSNAADNACQLSSTSCSDITIPIGHTPPDVWSYAMVETNSALSGVANNVIVENLSKKQFNANITLYDDATINRVGIYNNIYPYSTTTFEAGDNYVEFTLDFANINLVKDETDNTKIPIVVRVIDSFDTMGTYPAPTNPNKYSYIPYTIPTINESETIVKRIGQTSGRVGITITGTYYNGSVGNTNQGGTYKPTIKYKYWEVGASEPSTYGNTIPSSSITISNGTYSVSNYDIGTTITSATNYFDPEKAYRVKIQVNDTFKTTTLSEAKSVPLGEALWTEYKDRVDFKRLTVKGNDILYRNILTANAKTSQTLSTTSWTKVPVELTSSVGDKLEISNDGIKVLDGSYVLVNANILFSTGGTSSTRRGLAIYKNDTQISYCNIKGDTTYTGASITPLLIPVSANDIIYLYAINQGASGSVISTNDTYLNVEVVQ